MTKRFDVDQLVAFGVLQKWHPRELRLGIIFGEQDDDSVTGWRSWFSIGNQLKLLADEGVNWVIFFQALFSAVGCNSTFTAILRFTFGDFDLAD